MGIADLETLDEFITKSRTGYSRSNAYVTHPDFEELYVRISGRVGIEGDKTGEHLLYPVLDIARATAKKPGTGAATRLFQHIRTTYPYLPIYAECVHQQRVKNFLLRLGFTARTNGFDFLLINQ